jgi:MiaB-like tRNA modifying enzyme
MRYFVESYGCTMNYGEGEQLSGKMRSLGYVPSDSAEDADIVILNTCTVIETTERKMIRRIEGLKKKDKEIVVTGCMAAVQAEKILISLPDSLIVPPHSYGSVTEAVSGRYGPAENTVKGNGKGSNGDLGISAIIPIARGCLGNCTYCITKFARGRLVSYPADEIKEQFINALERGCKEILITAQDTACYGFDSGTSFPDLLKELLSVDGEYRIRIGMMNPESLGRILDPLMEVMKDDRVYKFIHVPVQSGSDAVLKRMGRPYTSGEFIDMVGKIRSYHEDITISTDVIAGFPGETDEDHIKNMDLFRMISPDAINVTRFSARPETEASAMKEQVHGRKSKERSRVLTSLRFNESENRNEKFIGRTLRVLVTEFGKDGTMISRSDSYRQVIVPGCAGLGEFLDVKITDCGPVHLFGSTV